MKFLFLSLLVLALIAGLTTYVYQHQSWKHELLQHGFFVLEEPRPLTEFSLKSQKNEPFSNKSFQGKWYLVFFGFTHCPDICPATLATLKQMMKKLEPQLQESTEIVLVSVDPARDTPDKLRQYTGFFGGDVIGLTGDFLELQALTSSMAVPFKKVMLEGSDYTVDHSGYIYLVGPDGRYYAFIKPPFDVNKLAKQYSTFRQHL